jgi:hypothetical protein
LFSLAQVGDGPPTDQFMNVRKVPVPVAGLSSGVAMVAVGGVGSV